MTTYRTTDATFLDKMLYMHFIPFKELREILSPITSLKAPRMNVFIDLYSMLTPLYRAYNYENPISLTACLANAAIHYRNFFKQYGTYANIFLVYSPTMSANNLRYCPYYNKNHIMERANNYEARKLVDNNLELFGTIVPYLPDIFLRIGTVEVSVIITAMILEFEKKGYRLPTLVVSSSPVAFQIPTIATNAIVLYRNKIHDIFLITSENALGSLIRCSKKVDTDVSDIDPAWVPGYLTYTGVPRRSMNSLLDYKSSLKLLRQIRDNNEILTGASLTNAYFNSNTKRSKSSEIALEINNRFSCLDFHNQLIMYRLMPEFHETSYLVQINDMEELFRLNDKYFRSNIMQLDKL